MKEAQHRKEARSFMLLPASVHGEGVGRGVVSLW
jgi:hypothetical protein